ncbi:MAG: hypothetical protein K0R84_2137 [Clostridia bacterium]|jgi:hypothetical protein|nr:hypothetical protein [Clostridia bacterium]
MFSLIRRGPQMLLVESNDIEGLKKYMVEKFNAVIEEDHDSIFGSVSEGSTILSITRQMKDILNEKDIVGKLAVAEEADVILCKLINERHSEFVKSIRTAPRLIILHSMGDLDRVVEEIQKDNGGTVGAFMELWNSGREKGTIVAVTDKLLNRAAHVKDLYEKCLYIEQGFYPLFKNLRLNALKYLNKGIGNKDWFEIEIRIYDRYSAYNLHYQRLVDIFNFLDLGIILGESWTKDYPRFMMAVGVYRLRFFTFYNLKYIKKILVGMEHLEDGTRIVDYDVYYQRKKMDWTDALEAGEPRIRHLLGLKYREEIFSRLSPQEAEEIKLYEQEIINTRY